MRSKERERERGEEGERGGGGREGGRESERERERTLVKCCFYFILFIQECRDPCCNATNCILSIGSECAEGTCCDGNCRVHNHS